MIAALTVVFANLLTGSNVRWAGCAPEPRQRIYFANHTSHLDALVLWAALPSELRPKTRPVAARDYWSRGRLRHWLATRLFNAVLIERQNISQSNNPLDGLMAALERRDSLILFPEGTRNESGELGAFKSGLFHLGRRRPDVEMIPVHIDNMNRILPKGEFLPVPLLSCITFGEPLRVREGESKADFLQRAREAVLNLMRK